VNRLGGFGFALLFLKIISNISFGGHSRTLAEESSFDGTESARVLAQITDKSSICRLITTKTVRIVFNILWQK
jgi:hypothetical protein